MQKECRFCVFAVWNSRSS